MSTFTSAVVVATDERSEAVAGAGLLAGYRGATRTSYATDLRLFADWCHQGRLTLFSVRRPCGAVRSLDGTERPDAISFDEDPGLTM